MSYCYILEATIFVILLFSAGLSFLAIEILRSIRKEWNESTKNDFKGEIK